MATTHRAPSHPVIPPEPQTPEAGAVPPPAPVVSPAAYQPAPFVPPRNAFSTDANLVMSLRQIYQTAMSWRPVPAGTVLSEPLVNTLEQIAQLAKNAVEAYNPSEGSG